MSISSLILPKLTDEPKNVCQIISIWKNNSTEFINTGTHSEIKVLSQRIMKYLNSKDMYLQWVACEMIRNVCNHPVILADHGLLYLTNLIKLAGLSKTVPELYEVVCESIFALCLLIRDKASLTRELLTPNLPQFISVLLKNLPSHWEMSVPILTNLVQHNPTLFRPFATNYETQLVTLMQNTETFCALSNELRTKIAISFVSLFKVNKNSKLQWSIYLQSVFHEYKSLINLLLAQFLDADDEFEALIPKLQLDTESGESSVHNRSLFKLDRLSIDLNDIKSLNQISDRFKLLQDLMVGFVVTPTTGTNVNFAMGSIVALIQLLTNIPSTFKKSVMLGNSNLKQALHNVIFDIKMSSVEIMKHLATVHKEKTLIVIELLQNSTEKILPTKTVEVKNSVTNRVYRKKVLDKELASKLRYNLVPLIEVGDCLLAVQNKGNLKEFSVFLKLIELSEILLQQETIKADILSVKKQNAVLSDFIRNSGHLLVTVDKTVTETVTNFYNQVVANIKELPMTQLTIIETFCIRETLKQFASKNAVVSGSIIKLCENLIVYPNANERYSILPIVVNLLNVGGYSNNEVISLLMNPRFPIVNKREVERFDKESLKVEEQEQEQVEEVENSEQVDLDKLKADITKEIEAKLRKELEMTKNSELEWTRKVEKRDNERESELYSEKTGAEIERKRKSSSDDIDAIEGGNDKKTKFETIKTAKTMQKFGESKEPNELDGLSKDDGSDFEIPDIEVSSDEE